MSISIRRLVLPALLLSVSTALFAQPTARSGARMVYDEDRATLILFGGLTPADSSRNRYPLGDTWEWNGHRWIRLYPPTSPPARTDFVMVYDSNRNRTVLFSGAVGVFEPNETPEVAADTWIFDDGNWTELAPPSSPPARRLAAGTFDPVRDRVVIFGGGDGAGNPSFDTWEFDGTTWTLIQADGPKVTNPVMAYDAARNEIWMLGIAEDNKSVMYRYTGSDWEKLSPEAIPPCATQGSMVYHERSGRVIFYGGLCTNGIPDDETWQWDGTNWHEVIVSRTAGPVFGAASAYDPVRQEIYLFGGDAFGPRSSTVRFTPDDQWLFVDNTFTPGPRSLMVFEADPVRNVIWLYGGQNESTRYVDLWSYSYGRWTRLGLTADAPIGCDYPVGAFDTDRGRLVILCGDASTFEFDGTKWYKFTDLKDKPPARRFSSMVYDPKNKRVVLFGGFDGIEYLNETWTWNGTAWTEVKTKDEPRRRALPQLFWDPVQQRVVVFGGIGRPTTEDAVVRYGDQWSFDGSNWTETTGVTLPSARYGAFVEWNPATNRVVMFGGKDERERYLNEHWEWTGAAWQQVDAGGRPSPRMNGMLAFDPSRQALTMYGGYAAAYFSEVWTYDGTRWQVQPEFQPQRRRATNP